MPCLPAIYHSTQRLCKARIFSDFLSWFHFWGWQLIIVAAAMTLPLGYHQGKEYAELEWPIDLAIAVVWVAFAINFFGTLARAPRTPPVRGALVLHRHDRDGRGPAHLQQPGDCPSAPLKSYPVYAGVQDAFMQWWYGHNAVALLPHHAVPGHDVLLSAQGGRAAGLLVPPEHRPLLVAGVHLHLGRPAPPALHGAAGMGLDAGHALLA